MSGKKNTEPKKEQPKTAEPVDEKKEEDEQVDPAKIEPQGNEKPQQIKIPTEVKTALDAIKGEKETYADVIQRLLINMTVTDAPEGDMVVLKMTKKSYQQVLAFQPSQFLSEILRKAKVA